MRINIEKILSFFGFILFIIALCYAFISWPNLPDQVPTHYNILGKPDAWGSKWFIFFIPLLGLAIWVFLYLSVNPKWINLPGSDSNSSPKQIALATKMTKVLGAEFFILICIMSIKDIYVGKGNTFSLGIWEMIIFMSVLFLTIAYYSWQILRSKNK